MSKIESEIIKVEYQYKHEDFCKVISYEYFIKKHINKGNKIPARILKKYLSLLTLTSELNNMRLEKWLNEKKEATISKYVNNPKYNFNVNRQVDSLGFDIPDGTKKIKAVTRKRKKNYSLEKLINEIFNDISTALAQDDKLKNRKELLTEHIYNSICEYRDKLTPSIKKDFSKYKIYVIVGFILTQFEFKLTEKKNPTNSDLYQAMRHLIENKLKLKSL